MPTHETRSAPSPQNQARDRARPVVYRWTALAAATGAIPVLATSAAIVAENAAMVNEVAGCFGVRISVETVVASMGMATSVNLIGRTVFVEAARAIGWFTGPLGVGGVIALGAATAALQTLTVGFLAIAIAENGGATLRRHQARVALDAAREEFERGAWRDREGAVA